MATTIRLEPKLSTETLRYHCHCVQVVRNNEHDAYNKWKYIVTVPGSCYVRSVKLVSLEAELEQLPVEVVLPGKPLIVASATVVLRMSRSLLGRALTSLLSPFSSAASPPRGAVQADGAAGSSEG